MEKNLTKIEQPEIKADYSDKLKKAIRLKNKKGIINVLKEINQHLTGLESGHFSDGQGIKDLENKVDDFLSNVERQRETSLKVYLGDGGLSRLVIYIEEDGNIDIEISRNSTDKVRGVWEKRK